MSVKRITWKTLVTQINATNVMVGLDAELKAIDDALNAYSESMSSTELKDLANYVDNNFLKSSGTKWENLTVYTSSFKDSDERFILLMKNKLREYVLFYKKVLEDEGIQRNMVYSKEYSNSGSASSTNRGTESVTPQNSNLYDSEHPESDSLFDQAIANFASSINKDKNSSNSSSSGDSSTTVTGASWEEAKENLKYLFFNELKEYIASIPERIYSYYSLDSLPAPEIIKKTFEYLVTMEELMHE